MINKFALYRFTAPFRSRLQDHLMKERSHLDVYAFTRGLEDGERHSEIAHALWELLREYAFVADFRPKPDDDLYKIFAMDEEIIQDEVLYELVTRLGLNIDGIDFTGFDFAAITTPKDVSRFLANVADSQSGEGKQNIE
jgi:DNA-directed RNA polymerase subunit F